MHRRVNHWRKHSIWVRPPRYFGQGGHDISAMDALFAPTRRACALSGFAGTGASTLAATIGVYPGILAVLRLAFAIRFHDHLFLIVHGSVPAWLPGFTGRSQEPTHQAKIHYTVVSFRACSMAAAFLNRLLARAIDAAVGTAGPAIFGQGFSKMFASPVQPHGEIVPRHAQCHRNVLRSLSLQINFFQQLPILLWHQRQ